MPARIVPCAGIQSKGAWRMEKPTLWTIQLVNTDLRRFDAYLRAEMDVMIHASLSARHEDQAMTAGWDTTNPHLYYYEWHFVSRERWPDVVWGVDKGPKFVIGWLTASDYVAGKLTVECGCLEEVKRIFHLLLDGIVTTFDSTDDRQQKQIIDITIAPAQQIDLQLPTIDGGTAPRKEPEATAAQPEPEFRRTTPSTRRSGNPGLECNRRAIRRLQEGQERAPNYQRWFNDYEEETGVNPDANSSGAAELYKKSVWKKWKKSGGKN
jgi:hypothetical protein